MKIQFVCSGNTYRSRLAEAYLKSKNIPNLFVSSSGIEADKNENGPVCDCTIDILDNHNLLQYLSECWTETNKKDIENQDIVIFMDKIHYEFCRKGLNCNISNYEIWNIFDISKEILSKKPRPIREIVLFTEDKFSEIKRKIDFLIIEKIKILF